MKMTIGIEDDGLKLLPLISNRTLGAMHRGCMVHVNEIDGTGGHMADVTVTGCGQDFETEYAVLCIILSDIIVENLQIRHLVRLLRHDHHYLTEKEQCDILVRALKNLWYGTGKSSRSVALCKKDVRQRLCSILFETDADTLILEGFMRFRMKDYLDTWSKELSACVGTYMRKKEYAEFVEILRLFIGVRIPRARWVHLGIGDDGRYLLMDEKRCVLRHTVGSKYTSEDDALLSTLVNTAPLHIVVHQQSRFADPRIIETIKDIFGGRVEFSEDTI